MITAEEQAMLDQKYENLMDKVREIDPALHKRLRARELAGFQKHIQVIENDDQQLELVL
tara:strand:- start:6782 stop:6958 length:177 start_codon:yes stop_codon:yes gene_type:complete